MQIAHMCEEMEPSAAMLIDRFQDSKDADLLIQTLKAMEDHGPAEESSEQEFRHNIIQLRIKRKDEECNRLRVRADADRSYAPAYQQSLNELRLLRVQLHRQPN